MPVLSGLSVPAAGGGDGDSPPMASIREAVTQGYLPTSSHFLLQSRARSLSSSSDVIRQSSQRASTSSSSSLDSAMRLRIYTASPDLPVCIKA